MSGIFDGIVVAGIPLLLVVLGLVQFVKGFGFSGTAVKLLSLSIGVLLGIGYQFSVSPPVDFSSWFAVVIFGLGLGLVARGVYDVAKSK